MQYYTFGFDEESQELCIITTPLANINVSTCPWASNMPLTLLNKSWKNCYEDLKMLKFTLVSLHLLQSLERAPPGAKKKQMGSLSTPSDVSGLSKKLIGLKYSFLWFLIKDCYTTSRKYKVSLVLSSAIDPCQLTRHICWNHFLMNLQKTIVGHQK